MSREIAIIYWKDSCKYGRTQQTEEDCAKMGLMHLISVGILINENEEFYTIGCDYCLEENVYRDVNTIPRSEVRKIRKIKIKTYGD